MVKVERVLHPIEVEGRGGFFAVATPVKDEIHGFDVQFFHQSAPIGKSIRYFVDGGNTPQEAIDQITRRLDMQLWGFLPFDEAVAVQRETLRKNSQGVMKEYHKQRGTAVSPTPAPVEYQDYEYTTDDESDTLGDDWGA